MSNPLEVSDLSINRKDISRKTENNFTSVYLTVIF
jgi:hypothetical protein